MSSELHANDTFSLDGSHPRIYHRILMAHEGQSQAYPILLTRSLLVQRYLHIGNQSLTHYP
jgi:hypothetical protein